MEQAACLGQVPASPGDPDIFFPNNRDEESQAKGFCLGCRVRPECDRWGKELHVDHGIWGGENRAKI